MSNLEGINFYGDYTLEHILCQNVIQFTRYGLLEIGAFYNIPTGHIGPNGQDHSRLHPVGVTGYTPYTVYAGAKPDWVYESGISMKASGAAAPIVPSGILYNGIFVPTGSAVATGINYYIDFSRGQVVFSSGTPSGTLVQCAHAERWVSVYPQESQEYYKLVPSLDWFAQAGGSGASLSNEQMAYLPCIFVSVPSYDTLRGYEMGSRTKVMAADISFDIFASNPSERAILQDVCYMMETKPLTLINFRTATKPLNYRGELVATGVTWKTMIGTNILKQAIFQENARVSKPARGHLPLKFAKVIIGLEIILNPS